MRTFWNSNRTTSRLLLGGLSLLGVGLTILAFLLARKEASRDFVRDFQEEATARVGLLSNYLNARLLFLDDLARHMELYPRPNPLNFRAFVANERARVKGIQALEWAPLVTPATRCELEGQIRHDQAAVKGITERDGQGITRSAGQRSSYYPVFFLEPQQGNQAALGYDLGSNPARLAAIEAARDSGEPKATEPITLVQETQSQAGFLIYVPVYDRALPQDGVEQRRMAFRGVVLGVFRTGDLLDAVLAGRPKKGLIGEIQDSVSSWKKGPIYAWRDATGTDVSTRLSLTTHALLPSLPAIHQQIPLAGRTWDVLLKPSPAYIARTLQLPVLLILPGGLALTGLMVFLFYLLITQKDRAEQQVFDRTIALAESLIKLECREEDLRLLLDSTAEAIYGLDLDGRCTFCNQALLRMLGYQDLDAVTGQNMHALIHHTRPDGSPFPVEECRLYKAFRDEVGTHADDEVIWRADGTCVPVEYWSFPQRREGRVVGAVVTCIDITERVQSAAEIRKNQAMVQNLLDSIPDLIFFKSLDGVYLACNPPLLELFGKSQEAVLGHTDFDLMDPASAEVCRAQDLLLLSKKKAVHNDEWATYPDGHRALFDILKTPYYSPKGELEGILGIARDITSRMIIEEGLLNRDRLLEAVNRSLVDLLDAGGWEEALPEFLSRLGVGSNASRTYLHQRDPGMSSDAELYMVQIQEWCAEGVSSTMSAPVPQILPMIESGLGRWVLELRANRVVSGHVLEFPPLERTLPQSRGVRSILLVPIFVKGMLWGVVGFEECLGLRAWSRPEQDILHLAGQGVGIVIERQEALRDLELARADLEQRVLNRTRDLQASNLELVAEVASRHLSEKRMTALTQGFLRFGPDVRTNLGTLLRLLVETSGAEQALFLIPGETGLKVENSVPELPEALPEMLRCLDILTLPRNQAIQADCLRSQTESPRTALVQGIWAEDRMVGVVVCLSHSGYDWSAEDKNVLNILAASAGIEELRRLAEAHHRSVQLQLLQAQKLESVGRLAAGIAHEINTPIQFLSMNLRFLEKTYAQLMEALAQTCSAAKSPEARDQDLEWIQEETPKVLQDSIEGIERVAQIVRAMKEFSHPGSPNPVKVDLNSNLESAVTVSRNEWKYVAEVHLELAPNLPLIQGFPSELNQVFLNLIINAAQAIGARPHSEGQLGTIYISTTPIPEGVEIRVKDTGTGILPEIQDKVFDPFFTTKEIGVGTGQGLNVCYQTVVNMHGGRIAFETVPGRGTTFIVQLPSEIQPAKAPAGKQGVA